MVIRSRFHAESVADSGALVADFCSIRLRVVGVRFVGNSNGDSHIRKYVDGGLGDDLDDDE
jgi:hypothetical protein